MKVELLYIYDRLSRGNYVWPFGESEYAIIASIDGRCISIPFNERDEFSSALVQAGLLLGGKIES